MVTTVLNSAGEIERYNTGKAPERPEVIADNAARAKDKPDKDTKEAKPAKEELKVEVKASEESKVDDSDDVEDKDGLTPRQKRELSEKMLKAIGKKHREKMEAEEFAAEQYNERRLAEQRAENLERQLTELKAQQAPKEEEPQEPKRENFATDQAYEDARIDWRAEQKFREKQREAAEKQERERQAEITRVASQRLEAAAKLVPDFEEVIATDLRIPGHIAGYMRESELFAELGYHFAKHPEAIERLAKLPPARALVEVGKIESTLKPFSANTEKANGESEKSEPSPNGATPSPETSAANAGASRQSRAPVIKPLNLSSAGQVEKPPGEMTYAEAKADWEKRRQVSLGRRRRH